MPTARSAARRPAPLRMRTHSEPRLPARRHSARAWQMCKCCVCQRRDQWAAELLASASLADWPDQMRYQRKATQKTAAAEPLGECPNCGGCSRLRLDPTSDKYVVVVLTVQGQPAEHRVPPLPEACICCLCGSAPPNGYCSRCMVPDRLKRSEISGSLVKVRTVVAEESWGVSTPKTVQ
ncbi:uncharacterized protein LOC126336108 [Schistocerca gregaria]|uniref:uncharacterized protein LOC126336108 n=1 Tax=Schistocerca gregaria TaxID=7010 RepID=UPI00211EE8FE|nr:uncharacterized protein LOC126336108 [Schistocerca gregaria]